MKKLLILILLFFLAGCSQPNLGVVEKEKKVEKLKAHKSKILKAQDINECVEWESEDKLECLKTKKVKQYHYISDVKVPAKKLQYKKNETNKREKAIELVEDLSKRTKNSIHFKAPKDEKMLGASEEQEDEYIGHFYAGNPFYEDDGEWKQTEVATTTIDNYKNNQVATSTVIINFIKWIGGYEALADSSTFYSGSGDGSVSYIWGAWATARNSAGNNSVSHTATRARVLSGEYNSNWGIGRNFYPVQTSDLPDDADISSASLHIFYGGKDGTTRTNKYYLVEGKQASYTSIEADDNLLSRMGSVEWGSITISSWVLEQDNEITLNSTGISGINKTGYSSFCLREAGDFNDSPPTYTYFGPYWHTSEATGTDEDPYLEVTYTIVGTSRRIILIN